MSLRSWCQRPRLWLYWSAVCVLALVVSLGGCFDDCGPPFPPSYIVDKFRVLAIKSEPPELKPGESARFSTLAATPTGIVATSSFSAFPACAKELSGGLNPQDDAGPGPKSPVTFWVACLPGLGVDSRTDRQCSQVTGALSGGGNRDAGTSADAGSRDAGPGGDGGPPQAPDFLQLMTPPCGPQSQWQAPSDYLKDLPKDKQAKGGDALVVHVTSFKKLRQITLKRVIVADRPTDQQNTNPKFTGITVDGKAVETCGPSDLNKCKPLVLPADKVVQLKATLDESKQDLLPPDKEGKRRKEDIEVVWFSTAGEFDTRRTIFSGQGRDKDSRWTQWFPNDFQGKPLQEGTEIQIVAVAKDLRYGIDWMSFRVKLGPPSKPPTSSP